MSDKAKWQFVKKTFKNHLFRHDYDTGDLYSHCKASHVIMDDARNDLADLDSRFDKCKICSKEASRLIRLGVIL